MAFLPIKKTERADYMLRDGKGRVSYNYAPLSEVIEATRKALAENELAIMQPTRVEDGRLFVETWLCHSSGEYVCSEMYVGDCTQAPQAEGSSLTYKRRYSLSSLLGIASEEDDDAREAEVAERPAMPVGETRTNAAPISGDHLCVEHNTLWFKRGKMRNFAHPIKGPDGKDTGEWCDEPVLPTGKQAEVSHPIEGEQGEPFDYVDHIVKGMDFQEWNDDKMKEFLARFNDSANLLEFTTVQLQAALEELKRLGREKVAADKLKSVGTPNEQGVARTARVVS